MQYLYKSRYWLQIIVVMAFCGLGVYVTTSTTWAAALREPNLASVNTESTLMDHAQTAHSTEKMMTEPHVKTGERLSENDEKLVSRLTDARKATIQIRSKGSFVDRQEGMRQNQAGKGSGFIIDESGIAVTNHHVVTGGASFEIYVGGGNKLHRAKVLGVSECADLAVIDIQGTGFNYFEWYRDPVEVGLDIYAAGFPEGDPEFTLTEGIISKRRASGDTNWASVEHVLEHTAKIQPGSSGGPLIDVNGRVVGINYAARASKDQNFAISTENAFNIIEGLKEGRNVDTIGINGQAYSDLITMYDRITSGIWVSSVESGSPADRVGIQPGDILLELEGLSLARDGTMNDYCGILRSHTTEDVLKIKVMREDSLDTVAILEGQLNGRTLQRTESLPAKSLVSGSISNEDGSSVPRQPRQNSIEDIEIARKAQLQSIKSAQGYAPQSILETSEAQERSGHPGEHVFDSRVPSVEEVHPALFDTVDTTEEIYEYVVITNTVANFLAPLKWKEQKDSDQPGSIGLKVTSNMRRFENSRAFEGAEILTTFDVASDLTPEDLLDEVDFSDNCIRGERIPHEYESYGLRYSSAYDIWTSCSDNEKNSAFTWAAISDTGDHAVKVSFWARSKADEEAFQVLINTLFVGDIDEVIGEQTENFAVDSLEAVNENGVLSVMIPTKWIDIARSDSIKGKIATLTLMAAPDLKLYIHDWTKSGFDVMAVSGTETSIAEALDNVKEGVPKSLCEYDGRHLYEDDSRYVGEYDNWINCGDRQSTIKNLVLRPRNTTNTLIQLTIVIAEDTPEAAYRQMLQTLTYNPSVETDSDGSAALDVSSEPDTSSDDVMNLVHNDDDTDDIDNTDPTGGMGKDN